MLPCLLQRMDGVHSEQCNSQAATHLTLAMAHPRSGLTMYCAR